MSSPLEYYNSIPPVTKTYAAACFFATGAYALELYNVRNIALFYSDVFKRFQIWRLITPFFFIGPFSLDFAFKLITILYYGAQLERSPFDKRTADFVWMYVFGAASLLVMTAIPYLRTPFLGPSMVFILPYVWSREFPNARVNIHGLFELKGFYLPYYMIAADLVLGNPLQQSMMGIAAGHLYYFLTVLYPLSTGNNILKTPRLIHKLVAFWGEGFQINSPFRNDPAEGVAFRGRGRRLNGSRSTSTRSEQRDSEPDETATPPPSSSASGVAFRGRSNRLGSR
ncbi:Derlin-1 [Forsythia ovata]|uniref:Derlin n=1 Tax=Forsythia ovata TaxID=205694 RepID=A0ABD1WK69_9LAMI